MAGEEDDIPPGGKRLFCDMIRSVDELTKGFVCSCVCSSPRIDHICSYSILYLI
jgi:hypothetical protein